MPQFKILHGGVVIDRKLYGSHVLSEDGQPMDLIELTEKDAKLIDPPPPDSDALTGGKCLQLKSEWDVEQAGEKAKAEAIAKAQADIQAKAEKAKADAQKSTKKEGAK